MKIKKSFKNEDRGKLYVVPTPIGNMEDMTFRAINVLNTVNLIAAEDTRHTKKLLNHFQINTPLVSYYQHNEISRTKGLIEQLVNGENIALVSDAGMPVVSDPGHYLISEAIENQIAVIVLPGANAALCALVGSGLPTKNFLFYGFLPKKKSLLHIELEGLKNAKPTIVFYESPFRVRQTLEAMEKYFAHRNVVIAREISKLHEEYVRGTVTEIVTWLREHSLKGEICIVLEGYTGTKHGIENSWWNDYQIDEHVAYYEREKHLSHKEALKQVAVDRDIPKKEVYASIHVKNK